MADVWDDWEASDKMPLAAFVEQVASEWAAGVEAFEKRHPNYQVPGDKIIARAVLKPMRNKKTGQDGVFIDIDEPAGEARSDIPIPVLRKPGT